MGLFSKVVKAVTPVKLILRCAAVLLAIAAVILFVAPFFTFTLVGESHSSGYELAFGLNNHDVVNGVLVAWILILVGLVLLIGIICYSLLHLVKSNVGSGKLLVFVGIVVASALILVGGILCFFTVQYLGSTSFLGHTITGNDFGKLGIGAIIAGILAVVSGGCGLASVVLK